MNDLTPYRAPKGGESWVRTAWAKSWLGPLSPLSTLWSFQAPRKDAISFPRGSLLEGNLDVEIPKCLLRKHGGDLGFLGMHPLDRVPPFPSLSLSLLICKIEVGRE